MSALDPASGGVPAPNHRILVIDDNQAIHEDFRKILGRSSGSSAELDELESALFGTQDTARPGEAQFDLDSAFQGNEGLEMVGKAAADHRPYAMAFVDVRMPPGLDGIETTERIWQTDPNIQIVICTAYSDYSWDETVGRLGVSDRMLILKKPFDNVEVRQIAHALTAKWMLLRQAQGQLIELERRVAERTRDLASANERLRREMEDRQRIEMELRHSQKLEAVGQLAAGIAHEINTPIQFIGDSVHFLGDSFRDLIQLIGRYESFIDRAGNGPAGRADLDEALAAAAEADIEYLRENVPRAIERTLEGTDRVAGIVRAMKEFAHPSHKEKALSDINRMIESTLTVARGEYKYVADIELALGDVPQIPCHAGDLNQVLLNLVVNAAHAIADANQGTDRRGTIRVETRGDGDAVVIAISDSGCGIPEAVRGRIFEPFFTTKEVGRGTGQGLPIARSIIVERHGGSLTFETELGRGTTFFVRLPLRAEDPPPVAAELGGAGADPVR